MTTVKSKNSRISIYQSIVFKYGFKSSTTGAPNSIRYLLFLLRKCSLNISYSCSPFPIQHNISNIWFRITRLLITVKLVGSFLLRTINGSTTWARASQNFKQMCLRDILSDYTYLLCLNSIFIFIWILFTYLHGNRFNISTQFSKMLTAFLLEQGENENYYETSRLEMC